MHPSAHQVRTSLVLAAAGATAIAALCLHGRTPMGPPPPSSDRMLTARLASSRILAGDREQDLAVTITAPRGRAQARPPISLAVVIDRSGSMSGEPMQNAKAAAARLVDELDEGDAFSIVTYSSSDETIVPITRATPENKAMARAAIARIWEDGGTCISCGLSRGAGELARTPLAGGLRRIVLISDGQANEGIWDRDELVQLAGDTAARGASISAVGVGLDFDEITMTRLAEVGRGNYYFVEHTAELGAMFARELGGLVETVATDVRLVVTDGSGARVEEAYGYPSVREGDQLIVPVADLRAGETRKVVLRVTMRDPRPGYVPVAELQLGWRRIADGVRVRAHARVAAEIVDDPAAVTASMDPDAVRAIEQARSARVLEEATRTYESQGAEAAQRVLQNHLAKVRANRYVPAPAKQAIEQVELEAASGFAKAPRGGAAATKAKKMTRAKAYELAR